MSERFEAYSVKVDMGKKIKEMFERLENDLPLKSFLNSAVGNFNNSFQDVKDEQEKITLAVVVGFVLHEVYNEAISEQLASQVENNSDKLINWKCKLEDGSDFIISTTDEDVIDNSLTKKVYEITGKKVVSPFVRVSKEETDELHKRLCEALREGKSKGEVDV